MNLIRRVGLAILKVANPNFLCKNIRFFFKIKRNCDRIKAVKLMKKQRVQEIM